MQTDLFEVHENNAFEPHYFEAIPSNQKILDESREILKSGSKRVYEFLMNGGEGTVYDLKCDRSRFSEFFDKGFKFSFKMNGRFKCWFASESDKEHNKNNMKRLLNNSEQIANQYTYNNLINV